MLHFTRFELENGLVVLHHFDETTPIAAVNILYNVGAKDEDPEKTGFAHLFEHLMFGGSKNIPSFDGELQSASGENNAFTSNDITNYYITLPVNNIETAFWLESDRMMALDFSLKSLDVQRNVVIEEFKQRYLNQPYGDSWLKIRPLAYKVHPYKWATIGKEIKHIEDATLDYVKEFFYNFYRPNNAILSVAGNISLDETKTLVNKWFGDIEKAEVVRRDIQKEPKQTEERRETVKGNVPYDALFMAWHCANRTDQRYYTTELLTNILTGSASSWLYNRLIKEQEMFSEIHCYQTDSTDEGLVIIQGYLAEGKTIEEGEAAILKELDILLKNGCTEADLEKVKNKKETIFTYSETEVLTKAMNLAFYEYLGNADLINTEMDKFRMVTKEDVLNVSREIFTKENQSVLYYLKEQN
jgi:zinc protease